jgi:hypothetical protein
MEYDCELNHPEEFYILRYNVLVIRRKSTDVSEERVVSTFKIEK